MYTLQVSNCAHRAIAIMFTESLGDLSVQWLLEFGVLWLLDADNGQVEGGLSEVQVQVLMLHEIITGFTPLHLAIYFQGQ